MTKAKPFTISKQIVWRAYKRIKANRGAAGVDGESLAAFEEDLENNLYNGDCLSPMESDVIGQLFPTAGAPCRDPKRYHGQKAAFGHSDRLGSDRADGMAMHDRL